MKKVILLSAVFFSCLQLSIFSLQAQTLYGTTFRGGIEGGGTINKLKPAINNLTIVKIFDSMGIHPTASLLKARDGKLYGMAYAGGSNGYGVIFSLDLSSSTYVKLKDFDSINGAHPYGSLMQASDEKLYGMTQTGGSADAGVIFSFDPSSSTYTKLKDLDRANGGYPLGSLMQANDGKLYGMTVSADNGEGYGIIFSFDPSSSTYTTLKGFDGTDGAHPYGSLIQASDGKLYGMTLGGGNVYEDRAGNIYSDGVIFSFDPSSFTYTKLKNFDSNSGRSPNGSLIQTGDGKLYGMTSEGGNSDVGVIFSFDPSSLTYTKLKDFDGVNGAYPYGSLMQATDGKLYGMTNRGGSSDAGVIFSFDPSTSTYTKLQDYTGPNGANPDIGSAFIEVTESNKDPMVKITSLTDGASFTAPATIILSADASDVDGTIKTVDFYNGNKLIFTETQAPFSRKWYNVGTGNYAITAKATDDSGNVTTSAIVNISVVPDKAPMVKITSPVDGAKYTALATIILSADASDTDGTVKTVDFYNGNTLIFTEQAAPFHRQWYNVPVGDYTITAKATDNNGVSTISAPVHITVLPNNFLTVNITNPVNGAIFTAPAGIILSADAKGPNDIMKTDFYNGNTLIFTEDVFPYSNRWRNVPAGNYSITVKATDSKGNVATSLPVALTVTNSVNTPGGSLNFDGLNDYVSIPHSNLLKPSSQISIEAWIKPTNIHSNRYYEIYRKEDGDEARHLFSFQEYGTILSFALNVGGNYTELDVPISASDYEGQWVHVAATFDGSAKKIYRNNALIGSENITGQIATQGTSPALIGSYLGQQEFFNGNIDELRIWNRALTLAEIEHNMDCELVLPQTGLIAYYKFNQGMNSGINTGITSLADQSGNHLNGTLNNFALNGTTSNWVGGKVSGTCAVDSPAHCSGNALQFDGVDDYVNVGVRPNLEMSDALTIEAWIYPTGEGSVDGGIIVNREGEYEIARRFGAIYVAIANSSPGWDWIYTGYYAPLNVWSHICFTYSASQQIFKFYANGEEVYSLSASGNIGDIGISKDLDEFWIGARQYDFGLPIKHQHFDGAIDEVRVWNKALTQSEIQQWMNKSVTSVHPGFANLAGYWKLDEDTGDTATDASGNGNTGTLINSPTRIISTAVNMLTFYPDNDGDGFGDPGSMIKACSAPAGYVSNNTDCNDANAAVHPGANEVCGNNIDDNCNGIVDENCSVASKLLANNQVNVSSTGSKLNFSNRPLSLNVNPNPVSKTLSVSVYGLQTNNKSTLSVLSVSGVLLKTIQSNTLNKNVQLDVSSLSAGVYFIKVINGDRVLYKQFVKL